MWRGGPEAAPHGAWGLGGRQESMSGWVGESRASYLGSECFLKGKQRESGERQEAVLGAGAPGRSGQAMSRASLGLRTLQTPPRSGGKAPRSRVGWRACQSGGLPPGGQALLGKEGIERQGGLRRPGLLAAFPLGGGREVNDLSSPFPSWEG